MGHKVTRSACIGKMKRLCDRKHPAVPGFIYARHNATREGGKDDWTDDESLDLLAMRDAGWDWLQISNRLRRSKKACQAHHQELEHDLRLSEAGFVFQEKQGWRKAA